jgi:hypothetical protein
MPLECTNQCWRASEHVRERQRTVNGNIDDVGAGSCSREHARGGDTGRVMGVDMNGKVGILCAD